MTSSGGNGRLVLLGAPLGDAGDASTRLRELLAAAEVVAAGDPRRLGQLAHDLGVELTGKIVSYVEDDEDDEDDEDRRTADLVAAVRGGALVALITDGGIPSVSDPGFRLVRATLDAGLPVTAAPGPNAVTTALALSGLPSDRFCFEGFLPRRPGERRSRLGALAGEPRTLVFFEAPRRIAATLADLAAAVGAGRPAALCREPTKAYGQVIRAPLGELAAPVTADPPPGEITLVVAGAPPTTHARPPDDELRAEVAARQATGMSRRDAIAAVAAAHDLPRRDVYSLATTAIT